MPQRNYARATNSYSNYKTNRVTPILIIIAILVFAFCLIKFTGVGGINESSYTAQRNQKLRSEAYNANTYVNKLSRLGATTASGTLSLVRQYIHGVDVINQMNVSMYGESGRLYSQSELEYIYGLIDEYDTKLSSGSKVTEILATLQ